MNVFLLPALGADGQPVLVRDPITRKPLDPNGEWKPHNGFWERRLRDKDVVKGAHAIPAVADGQMHEANLGTMDGLVPGHTAPPAGDPPAPAPEAPTTRRKPPAHRPPARA